MKSRISCCLNMSIAFKLLNKIVLDMTQLDMTQLNFNNVKNFYDEIIFLKKKFWSRVLKETNSQKQRDMNKAEWSLLMW